MFDGSLALRRSDGFITYYNSFHTRPWLANRDLIASLALTSSARCGAVGRQAKPGRVSMTYATFELSKLSSSQGSASSISKAAAATYPFSAECYSVTLSSCSMTSVLDSRCGAVTSCRHGVSHQQLRRAVPATTAAVRGRGRLLVVSFKEDNKKESLERVIRKQEKELLDQKGASSPGKQQVVDPEVVEYNQPARPSSSSTVRGYQAEPKDKEPVDPLQARLFGRSHVRPSYNAGAFEAPLGLPVFSRRREVWAGRFAMLGWAVATWKEIVDPNHPGAIRQLSGLLHVPGLVTDLLLLALLAHGVAGLLPGSPTWSEQNFKDLMRRPAGPTRRPINPFQHPGEFFGASVWGFTKKNEVFSGRVAMVGFLAAVLGEIFTGRGGIGQIAGWLGVNPSGSFYAVMGGLMIAYSVFAGWYAYHLNRPFEVTGDDDIYS